MKKDRSGAEICVLSPPFGPTENLCNRLLHKFLGAAT